MNPKVKEELLNLINNKFSEESIIKYKSKCIEQKRNDTFYWLPKTNLSILFRDDDDDSPYKCDIYWTNGQDLKFVGNITKDFKIVLDPEKGIATKYADGIERMQQLAGMA